MIRPAHTIQVRVGASLNGKLLAPARGLQRTSNPLISLQSLKTLPGFRQRQVRRRTEDTTNA
jgi:hypothetical protein